MTKNEMRVSLKLINTYTKQEYPNINEITIVNYEPLISDYTIRFRVITDDDLKFSKRYQISKYIQKVFNIFGYGINCEVVFQYKSSE
jgi:hypothetical protein